MSRMTALCSNLDELRANRGQARPSAVVMTMGALHDGHAELIRRARQQVGESGHVTVTDFVNPTQFSAGEDFSRYPRTLEHDVDVCTRAGADAVYAPTVEEVYGTSDVTAATGRITVDPGPLGEVLEGASRPGHFRGVLTVVATLLNLTDPDVAMFGEKDYQQLALISEMVEALRFPVTVIGVPTVREEDGLAMSSRNRYLGPEERAAAAVVPRALEAAVAAAGGGATAAREAGLRVLSTEPTAQVDYLSVTDLHLGSPVHGPGRILVAVRIGTTRLIDNMSCEIGAG